MTSLQMDMVAVPEPTDENPRFNVVIRGIEGERKTRALQGSVTFAELYNQTGSDFGLMPSSFELAFIGDGGAEQILPITDTQRLDSLPLKRLSTFEIREKDDGPPIKTTSDEGVGGTDAAELDSAPRKRPLGPVEGPSQFRGSRSSYEDDRHTKSSTGFVGLCNQGATCYLNSLLQSLFMTPEFRRAIYTWQRPADTKTCRISTELQRLFLLLETSADRAVETTAVTQSFGWDQSDSFEQHDVQELMRVLFEALEKEWKSDALQKLYEGTMEDYVRCKECDYVSARTDKYMDIPLVLKPFGSTVVHASVQEALSKFIEVEVLQGDNQYSCEKCAKKVDAFKGLKFTSFPYFLTMQLKRFDFDTNTFRRIKLNDRFTFPFELDMEPYLAPGVTSPHPLKYRLFSVMVHSGSALGGHYYAHIYSFDQGKWYTFNDSTVREISESDVEQAFGSQPTGAYSAYAGSTNAYMLIYRRIEESNKLPFTDAEMPAHITTLKSTILQEENNRIEEENRRRNQIELTVFYTRDVNMEPEKRLLVTNIKRPLQEVLAEAVKLWELDPNVTARLRRYLAYSNSLGEIFQPADMTKPLESFHLKWQPVMLEVAQEDGSFVEHNAAEKAVNICWFDAATKEFGQARRIFIHETSNLGDLKAAAAKFFNLPAADLAVVKQMKSNAVAMEDDTRSLELTYTSGAKYYFCSKSANVGMSAAVSTDCLATAVSSISIQSTTSSDTTVGESGEGDMSPPPPYTKTPQNVLLEAVETLSNTIELAVVNIGQPPESEGQKIQLDWRMLIGDMKEKLLVPIAGLPSTEFQIFRHHYGELEVHQLDSIVKSIVSSGDKLILRKGKALKIGEQMVSFHLLNPDTYEADPLLEFGVLSNTPVATVKQMLVEKAQQTARDDPKWKYKDVALSADRIRLREMQYSNHAILVDSEPLELNWKKSLCVQILNGPETRTSTKQISLFLRCFQPDTLEIGKLDEIVLPTDASKCGEEPLTVADLTARIAEIAGIPLEHVVVSRVFGSFPFNDNPLDCLRLQWTASSNKSLRESPLLINTDGVCIIYKDSTLPTKEPTEEERDKIIKEHAARQRKARGNYRRKEVVLKIKTHTDEPAVAVAGGNSGDAPAASDSNSATAKEA
eukprot:m.212329 g.212329  ORF g.212329 m.212329 type:complete len:1131 (-) comp20082_c0_seq1:1073-4465(-)